MRKTVTVGAFWRAVGILYLAWGKGMIHFMTEGALLLMFFALRFQEIKNADMTLGALLHGQRLDVLVIERGTRRHLLDLIR